MRRGEEGGGVGGDAGGDVGPRPLGVLSAAAADGYVAEGAAVSPVPTAGLAEVARLGEVVVVVVAELGVWGIASGAFEGGFMRTWRRRSR